LVSPVRDAIVVENILLALIIVGTIYLEGSIVLFGSREKHNSAKTKTCSDSYYDSILGPETASFM
jgi:hypothetical protein